MKAALPIATAIAVAATMTQAAPADAASSAQLKRQVASLKLDVRFEHRRFLRANTRAAGLARQRKALRTRIARLVAAEQTQAFAVAAAQGTAANLTSENQRLAAENAGLRGTLPEQVAAVARTGNIAELFRVVITPAHGAWACGGNRFTGDTFWSYDFDRRASDGTCY